MVPPLLHVSLRDHPRVGGVDGPERLGHQRPCESELLRLGLGQQVQELLVGHAVAAGAGDRTLGDVHAAGGLAIREREERDEILRELDRHDWNRTETAAALGYSRVTLWKKMRKYTIDEGVFRRGG